MNDTNTKILTIDASATLSKLNEQDDWLHSNDYFDWQWIDVSKLDRFKAYGNLLTPLLERV